MSGFEPAVKILNIQYLRGLAALAVVFCHYNHGFQKFPFFFAVINSGQIGIHVFFMISGFVIFHSLSNSNYKPSRFLSFLLKRSIRIDPPYIVTIFLTVLTGYIISRQPTFNRPVTTFIPERFFAHVFYIVPFTGWTYYNNVFWTLSVEFQFYVFIGLLFFLREDVIYRSVMSVILCVLVFIPLNGKDQFLIGYGPIFALGISFLSYYNDRILVNLIIPAFCSLIIAYTFGVVVCAILMLCCLFVIHNRLIIKPLNFMGDISYSLYLIHGLVQICFIGLLKREDVDVLQHPFFWLFIKVGAAILIAVIFSYLFEKPFIKLSRKISLNKQL